MPENYWAARKMLDDLDKIQSGIIMPLLYPEINNKVSKLEERIKKR